MASSSQSNRPWPSSSSSSSSSSPPRPILGRLILLRHPNTEANAAGVLQGSTDSPLTEHGVRQLERLCAFFEQEPNDDVEGRPRGAGFALDELPVIIAHSPLERCARLARGVAGVVEKRMGRPKEGGSERQLRHSGVDEPTSDSRPPPPLSDSPATSTTTAASPPQLLYPSIDLQEKDFGPLECTRRGIHAGSSFPTAPPGAKRETDDQFRSRVQRSMRLWITKLVKRSQKDREEWELEQETERITTGDALSGEKQPPSRPTPPTLLVVTHGMFISTALRILAPSISPTSPTLSVDSPVSFADNTGMFLLEVVAAGVGASTDASSSSWSLRLVRANWTPHLVGLTRPSKRGRDLAAAAADGRQRKLDGFFAGGAGTGKQKSEKRKREDDDDDDEEQRRAS